MKENLLDQLTDKYAGRTSTPTPLQIQRVIDPKGFEDLESIHLPSQLDLEEKDERTQS